MDKFLSEQTKKTISDVVLSYKGKREKALEGYGMGEQEFKDKMTALRKKPFNDFESNLEIAKKNLEKNGFEVFEARDSGEAKEILEGLLKDTERIVKSKSNTAKEIGIDEILNSEEIKNKFLGETDLGDHIVELFGEEDQHYVLPAIHIAPEKISQKVKEKFGDEVEADAEKLTHYLCGKIREKIIQADTGITGANFFTKDGQVVLLENEGNISLITRVPKTHIIICGVDKITDSAEDALGLCKAAAVFGTGQPITQYISVISGPSKTADIQNQLVQGAQGAKKVKIVLIDNGRREMLKNDFRDLLRCINCGACINFCPAYHQIGAKYGGDYIGSKGIVMNSIISHLRQDSGGQASIKYKEESSKAFNNSLFACTLCGNCKENCPMRINLPEMVRKVRAKNHEKNQQSPENKEMIKKTKETGNPFGAKSDKEIPDKLYCC